MDVNEQLFQKFGKSFPADTVLFREGETTRDVFILQSGKVKISKRIREIEKLLDILAEPGEFFGEMSFINNRPRIATATVVEEAKVLVIEPEVFEKMLLANTEIAFRFIKKLAARLEEADAQIENLLLKDHESRIVHYLAHLVEGTRSQSVADVAAMCGWLGLEESSVREVMDKLAKKGLVAAADGGFNVQSAEMLRKYLEFLEMKQKFGEY
ncbi:MAG: Crp/Fnr family transcriptional regulator [Deltaproteobacteria bacterium]|nr:Crp/Fnr family transcriptional regulator [Deltaproteobacteria bacterium]